MEHMPNMTPIPPRPPLTLSSPSLSYSSTHTTSSTASPTSPVSPSSLSSSSTFANRTSYFLYAESDEDLPNYEEALRQPRHHEAASPPPLVPPPNTRTRSAMTTSTTSSTLSSPDSLSSFSTSSSDSVSVSSLTYHSSSSSVTTATTLLNSATPPLNLIFDRNSVTNATLYSRSGPRYKIITNKTSTRTDVCDLMHSDIGLEGASQRAPLMVASVRRRELLPNVVVFKHRQNKAISTGKWLRKEKGGPPGLPPTSELITPDGRYTWISNSVHRLALYQTSELVSCQFSTQSLTPLAYSKTIEDPPTLALVIRQDCDFLLKDAMQIETITSFLVLENKMRMKEKMLSVDGGNDRGMRYEFGALGAEHASGRFT